MLSPEDELRLLEPVLRRMVRAALLGKKLLVRGEENFVRSGPNIIIGNHVGTYKDVALLFRVVPRQIFFLANRQIFNRQEFSILVRKHLKKHLKKFGLFLNLMINPYKFLIVEYISTHIARIGSIPVDLVDNSRFRSRERCQDYLKKNRAIVSLQGRGRVNPREPNPYVSRFKPGASSIAYHLYTEERISVPVTPLAIHGTQLPFLIPGHIRVNVGPPMFIKDYLAEGALETVDRFRSALEARVKALFMDLIKP
ncbi:MAG: hypothetical protein A2Y69_09095 [Candidatus Aminicenantes bacterium RBG_13_59_9]|nr:MAG: hypothetical protein A2Y69_09095 [Candidatus Aminicenantes bacterium RBG_13_59_9]